jgi:hypothetical protein
VVTRGTSLNAALSLASGGEQREVERSRQMRLMLRIRRCSRRPRGGGSPKHGEAAHLGRLSHLLIPPSVSDYGSTTTVQVYVPGGRLSKTLGVPSGRGCAEGSPVH